MKSKAWSIILVVIALSYIGFDSFYSSRNIVEHIVASDGGGAGFCYKDDAGNCRTDGPLPYVFWARYEDEFYGVVLVRKKDDRTSLTSLDNRNGVVSTKVNGWQLKLPGPGFYSIEPKGDHFRLEKVDRIDAYPEELGEYIEYNGGPVGG